MPEGVVIDISGAEQVGTYQLRLHFSDGAVRVVDFEPFLLAQIGNPTCAMCATAAAHSSHASESSQVGGGERVLRAYASMSWFCRASTI